MWPESYFKCNSITVFNREKCCLLQVLFSLLCWLVLSVMSFSEFILERLIHLRNNSIVQKNRDLYTVHRPTWWSRRNIFFAITRLVLHPCLLLRVRCVLIKRLESVMAAALCFQLHYLRESHDCLLWSWAYCNWYSSHSWLDPEEAEPLKPHAGRNLQTNMWLSLFYCLDPSSSTW